MPPVVRWHQWLCCAVLGEGFLNDRVGHATAYSIVKVALRQMVFRPAESVACASTR